MDKKIALKFLTLVNLDETSILGSVVPIFTGYPNNYKKPFYAEFRCEIRKGYFSRH